MIINDNILRAYMPPSASRKPQIFENLDQDSLHAIFENSILHNYEAGRLLIQQGDTPTHMFLIIKGSLKTLRADDKGNEAVIRLLKDGETCMESAIFMDSPSPINVQIIEDAQLLLIPSAFVKSHVLADAQFATNIIRIVTEHYKSALHQIDDISIKSPVQRVGRYLLAQHLEKKHNALDFELPFKKALIASHLGMTPETFSRALSKIKSMGINVQGEIIKLKDSFSLCHFCDPDLAHNCSNAQKEECPNCPLH